MINGRCLHVLHSFSLDYKGRQADIQESKEAGDPDGQSAFTADGAVSVGPYSHAVESGDLVYLSGQTPIDAETGKLVEGDIAAQTEQSFKNLFNVLRSAGLTPDDIIKVNVFLTDMSNFQAMNLDLCPTVFSTLSGPDNHWR